MVTSASGTQTQTDWQIVPNLAFDVLCLFNPLSEDEFYRQFHQETVAHFEPLLTPEAREALASLKRIIKDEGQSIISAHLTMHYSAVEVATIDDLIAATEDPSTLKANLKQTIYYDEQEWGWFEASRPHLLTLFDFLKSINFEQWWRENSLPTLEAKITELEPQLPQYDVVSEVERHLGFKLPSNAITVYLSAFTRPHGIKIVGTRFINEVRVPFSIVLNTAVHEMMHPPYMIDDELRAAAETLKSDEFLMDKILNHNASFGYNTFEGYLEENCVKALDQYITEHFNMAMNPVKRWQQSDDGMHVLAAVLHQKLKQAQFPQNGQSFRAFLIDLLKSGSLNNIKAQFEQIMTTG